LGLRFHRPGFRVQDLPPPNTARHVAAAAVASVSIAHTTA